MSNTPKNASEKQFQENVVQRMTAYHWQAPDFLNGNLHKVTVQTLVENWRKEVNRINHDVLEGIALTDNEWMQVMQKVSTISNSFEAAKILSMENATGKIDGIKRDPHPSVTREVMTLKIFLKAQIDGGNSRYQIAREVQTPNGNRFDIVLLINGLPVILIEQKRSDKSLDEAFYQFKRYYQDGEYTYNFMAFAQMMVVMSEVDTRYFATPKSVDDFNLSFVFRWAYTSHEADVTKNDQPMTFWQDIVDRFFRIPMAHQLVGDYLVIDDAKEEQNRRHYIMRPYQVYALQAVELAALGGHGTTPHGGFVWHTTGSGKTITSFKTAMILSTRGGFDKVVFLVDRKDLDQQTSENFRAYATYDKVDVDDTPSTATLYRNLMRKGGGIVVSTIFKLHHLIKELQENQNDTLAQKRMAFIIDESHRTTMGEMMVTIRQYFNKKSLFFGFTGTPLFEENKSNGMINEKSEHINTTEKLFGPMLHRYTIDQAITDGNVLGFHVDYINTGEFANYDALRDKVIEQRMMENPNRKEIEVEREVHEMDDASLEAEAREKKILIYHDETHIPQVVSRMLDNWETQSQQQQFNAILAVGYKKRAIAYYREFKKQLQERQLSLNVTTTFSSGEENTSHHLDDQSIMEEVFNDYEALTGLVFHVGDSKQGERQFFADLSQRARRGGSGLHPKNLDLVIVAKQLLTGYDAKRLNTLYVDTPLELQGLIQAYSRTNRIFGKQKEFGTIINFQYPALTRKEVDRALQLYSNGGTNSHVMMPEYDEAVAHLEETLTVLQQSLPDPTRWVEIRGHQDKEELFKEAFKASNHQLRFVQQYYEYQWSEERFGMEQATWQHYCGAFLNLFPKEVKDEQTIPVTPLEGRTRLSGTQRVDAAFMTQLIGEKVTVEGNVLTIDSENLRLIYESIQEMSQQGEDKKAQLLKRFVDEELVKGHLTGTQSFDEAFEEWKATLQKQSIHQVSLDWGMDATLLWESVETAKQQHTTEVPYVEELINSIDISKARNPLGTRLQHRMRVAKELPAKIEEVIEDFD